MFMLFFKKNLTLVIGMIIVLGTYLVGCEKIPVVEKPPVINISYRTVLVSQKGKGTVNPDTLTKVVYGEPLTITATPDSGYTLYSLKIISVVPNREVEEEYVEIEPTTAAFHYTFSAVKANIEIYFEFIETDNLIISILNPPWRLKAMEDFSPDGELLFSWPLTEEILSQMFYFYYPEGKVEAFYPNGTLCFNGPWSLKERVLKIGNYYFPIVELTPTKLVYKMQQVEGRIYTLYTYERN